MNYSNHTSKEKVEAMLRYHRHNQNNELSNIQKLKEKVSDQELLDSIDNNIIEIYLRSKKIKKIQNKIQHG